MTEYLSLRVINDKQPPFDYDKSIVKSQGMYIPKVRMDGDYLALTPCESLKEAQDLLSNFDADYGEKLLGVPWSVFCHTEGNHAKLF